MPRFLATPRRFSDGAIVGVMPEDWAGCAPVFMPGLFKVGVCGLGIVGIGEFKSGVDAPPVLIEPEAFDPGYGLNEENLSGSGF
jgi:hypothetical protein